MLLIILICGVAFAVLHESEPGADDRELGSPRHIAAMIVLLMLFGTRWMPALGLNPMAAVNGSVFVCFIIVLLMGLAGRICP